MPVCIRSMQEKPPDIVEAPKDSARSSGTVPELENETWVKRPRVHSRANPPEKYIMGFVGSDGIQKAAKHRPIDFVLVRDPEERGSLDGDVGECGSGACSSEASV